MRNCSFFLLLSFFTNLPASNVCAQWSTTTLSVARQSSASASVGRYVFIAGGNNSSGSSDVVDVYDTKLKQWVTSQLSQPRYRLAGASVGSKVLFAGGMSYGSGSPLYHSTVDIFDTLTRSWSVSSLSEARYGIATMILLMIGLTSLIVRPEHGPPPCSL